MRSTIRVLGIIISGIVLALLVTSCSIGLDPAWKADSDEQTLAFNFASVPLVSSSVSPVSGNRAVVQGGGYLYIQTGLTLVDAKIYGPFSVVPGVEFRTSAIPSGFYPFMALVYVKNPDANATTQPIIPANADSAGFLSALTTLWAGSIDTRETASFKLLTNVNIVEGTVNYIQATLIPVSINGLAHNGLNVTGDPLNITRRFMKLTGVSAAFLGAGGTKMAFNFTTMSTPCTINAIGLYSEQGALISYTTVPLSVPYGPTVTYPVVWDNADTYYVYIEFIASSVTIGFSTLP